MTIFIKTTHPDLLDVINSLEFAARDILILSGDDNIYQQQLAIGLRFNMIIESNSINEFMDAINIVSFEAKTPYQFI